jgi:hypothetical protein
MTTDPYLVSVVLDPDYGPRLRQLLRSGPVWIVDTPTNRGCAQELWKENPCLDHLEGVTVFKTAEGRSPEQLLIGEIGTIDLHHGIYSAEPAYTVLRVIGNVCTPDVKTALANFGFNSFKLTREGFDAVRPLPPSPGR